MVHLRHRNLLQTMAATIFPLFYRHRAARERYFCRFIVVAQRGNDIFAVLSSSRGAATIFLPFYRHRAAREQYFCRFIVTARRGNDIFALLSSPRGAGTIFLRFIVTVRRGNNIFAVLSSPRGAGTIFLPFYRHRAAREQYFCRFSACSAPANTFPNGFDVCRPTASIQECGENRAGMAAGLMQRGKRKAAIRNRMTAFCFEVPSRVELLYTVLQTVT